MGRAEESILQRGMSVEWVKKVRLGRGDVEGELIERDREIQTQERAERILRSRSNRWYRELRTIRIPRYLKKRGKEERMMRVARFRLGNEIKEGRYWETEKKRRCRLCKWELET